MTNGIFGEMEFSRHEKIMSGKLLISDAALMHSTFSEPLPTYRYLSI